MIRATLVVALVAACTNAVKLQTEFGLPSMPSLGGGLDSLAGGVTGIADAATLEVPGQADLTSAATGAASGVTAGVTPGTLTSPGTLVTTVQGNVDTVAANG